MAKKIKVVDNAVTATTEQKFLDTALDAIKSPISAFNGKEDEYISEKSAAVQSSIAMIVGGLVGSFVGGILNENGRNFIGLSK